jgi:hypothetical protein
MITLGICQPEDVIMPDMHINSGFVNLTNYNLNDLGNNKVQDTAKKDDKGKVKDKVCISREDSGKTKQAKLGGFIKNLKNLEDSIKDTLSGEKETEAGEETSKGKNDTAVKQQAQRAKQLSRMSNVAFSITGGPVGRKQVA